MQIQSQMLMAYQGRANEGGVGDLTPPTVGNFQYNFYKKKFIHPIFI